MRLQDYDTRTRFQAAVAATRRITPVESPEEVRELVLDLEPGDFHIEVGQSLGVLAPGQDEFGQDEHFRLYSVANVPERLDDGRLRLEICVRRCSYIDDYSGEEYPGVASNYLCDLREGDTLTLTGPYGLAFEVPDDPEANLIMVGMGTGIAPFRAFVKHLYGGGNVFRGRVFLFHGGRTGLELLYMNDEEDDFAQYYDQDTFQAIRALSARPTWTPRIDWGEALESRSEELWEMLGQPNTYVYVAGLVIIRDELDVVFARIAGSRERWIRRKAELEAGRRWVELVY